MRVGSKPAGGLPGTEDEAAALVVIRQGPGAAASWQGIAQSRLVKYAGIRPVRNCTGPAGSSEATSAATVRNRRASTTVVFCTAYRSLRRFYFLMMVFSRRTGAIMCCVTIGPSR